MVSVSVGEDLSSRLSCSSGEPVRAPWGHPRKPRTQLGSIYKVGLEFQRCRDLKSPPLSLRPEGPRCSAKRYACQVSHRRDTGAGRYLPSPGHLPKGGGPGARPWSSEVPLTKFHLRASGLDGSKCPRRDTFLRLLLLAARMTPGVTSRVKPRCLALHLLLNLQPNPLPPGLPQPLRTDRPILSPRLSPSSSESWAPSLPGPFLSHFSWDYSFPNWVLGQSGLSSSRALSTLFSFLHSPTQARPGPQGMLASQGSFQNANGVMPLGHLAPSGSQPLGPHCLLPPQSVRVCV